MLLWYREFLVEFGEFLQKPFCAYKTDKRANMSANKFISICFISNSERATLASHPIACLNA